MIASRLNLLIRVMSCLIVLALPIFIVGCGDEGEDEESENDVVTPPVTQPPQFQKDVFPIFQANCLFAGCHLSNPPSGLLLTTYDNFKKGGGSGPAFTPKDSKGSLIVKRIDGGGMPLGKPPLKKEEIQLIKDWIDAGAENN